MRDEEIDFSEIPELTPEMFRYKVVRRNMLTEPRDDLTLHIDRDVLTWFKKRGSDYKTLINFLLRSYMQEQQRKWAKSTRAKARRA